MAANNRGLGCWRRALCVMCAMSVCACVSPMSVCACVSPMSVCACVSPMSVCACVSPMSVCACVSRWRMCACVSRWRIERRADSQVGKHTHRSTTDTDGKIAHRGYSPDPTPTHIFLFPPPSHPSKRDALLHSLGASTRAVPSVGLYPEPHNNPLPALGSAATRLAELSRAWLHALSGECVCVCVVCLPCRPPASLPSALPPTPHHRPRSSCGFNL